MPGVDRIYLEDDEESGVPPDGPLLELGIVGNRIFLAIGKRSETYTERKFVAEAQYCVNIETLRMAIDTLEILSPSLHPVRP